MRDEVALHDKWVPEAPAKVQTGVTAADAWLSAAPQESRHSQSVVYPFQGIVQAARL
jgi:hypothetical protein